MVMKKLLLLVVSILSLSCYGQMRNMQDWDWAGFDRYAEANSQLTETPDVVFIGDSITEIWATTDPDFFPSHNYLGRGIGGQSTANILCRFQRDVVDLHPKAVVISCGTNDVAKNNGRISPQNVVSEIKSMCEIARVHGIVPLVASVPPSNHFFWRPDDTPAQAIIELNRHIKEYVDANGIQYIDYHSAMKAEDGSLPEKYSEDGCHPILEGYRLMESVVVPMLEKILDK